MTCGQKLRHHLPVSGGSKLEELRRLAATRRQLDAQIDALTESLLRDGEFVEDIADTQGVSREKIRRFRKDRDIHDTREVRRVKRAPARRHQNGVGRVVPEDSPVSGEARP